MKTLGALAVTICASPVFFFATEGLAQTSPQSSANVQGLVLSETTGTPLPQSLVRVISESGELRDTATDSNGRFEIDGLAPGRYTIAGSRAGFLAASAGLGQRSVVLADGDRLEDLRLILTPTSIISGQIYDERGSPQDGTRVIPFQRRYENGKRFLAPPGAALGLWYPGSGGPRESVSDETGHYRLEGLEPGEYFIGIWPNVQNSSQLPPGLYFPGVWDPADSLPVVVGAGVERGAVDISIPELQEYNVGFRVVEPNTCEEAPARSVLHVLRRSRDGTTVKEREAEIVLPEALPDEEGRPVSVKLSPGTYQIYYAYCDSVPGPQAVGQLDVTVQDMDIDTGTLALRPSVTLEGRICCVESLPVSIQPERLRLVLRPVDGQPAGLLPFKGLQLTRLFLGNLGLGTGSPDGFALDNVPTGTYQVELDGLPPDVYISSIRMGTGVDDSGLVLDERSDLLEISLSAPGGVIEGVARDALDEPARSSTVVLIPAPDRRRLLRLFRLASTDEFGRFSIRGIAPGDYSVVALERVPDGAHESIEFLTTFAARGTRVTVYDREREMVDLRLISTDR